MPFFLLGAWFGIEGVIETTLKEAGTHLPTRVVTTGVYSIVRYPQYLGGLIVHVAIIFIFSALYSLLITPLIAVFCFPPFKKGRKRADERVR